MIGRGVSMGVPGPNPAPDPGPATPEPQTPDSPETPNQPPLPTYQDPPPVNPIATARPSTREGANPCHSLRDSRMRNAA